MAALNADRLDDQAGQLLKRNHNGGMLVLEQTLTCLCNTK